MNSFDSTIEKSESEVELRKMMDSVGNIEKEVDEIQKMIDAFDLMKYAGGTHTANEEKTIDEGLTLFCKYFRNLWD